MIRRWPVIVITAVAVLTAAMAGWATAPLAAPAMAGECSSVASRFEPEPFLALLADCGIKVQSRTGSHTGEILGLLPGSSIAIQTSIGAMDVSFFPGPVADKVSVRPVGPLTWEVQGLSGRPPLQVGSNHQIYFIIHRNLMIEIHSQELHAAMRGLLHVKE